MKKSTIRVILIQKTKPISDKEKESEPSTDDLIRDNQGEYGYDEYEQ